MYRYSFRGPGYAIRILVGGCVHGVVYLSEALLLCRQGNAGSIPKRVDDAAASAVHSAAALSHLVRYNIYVT